MHLRNILHSFISLLDRQMDDQTIIPWSAKDIYWLDLANR